MEDKTGNIWFASQDNGVFRYDGKAIKNITEKEGLGDNYAGGMIQDKTGNFWFTMKVAFADMLEKPCTCMALLVCRLI